MPSSSRTAHHVAAALKPRQLSAQPRSFTAFAPRNDSSRLPRIARPSLWRSLVPRFLRRRTEEEEIVTGAASRLDTGTKRSGASIATLGILLGSFAINVIALRHDLVNYSRNTEAKLNLLREVVQRLKAGDEVDVKRLLGTGDPEKEKEWEEVIQELEDYNRLEDRSPKDTKKDSVEELKTAAASWFGNWARRDTLKPDKDEVVKEAGAVDGQSPQHAERRPVFLM